MKRIIIGISIVFVVIAAAVLTGANYLVDYALKPQRAPMDDSTAYGRLFADYPHLRTWVDSLERNHALRDTTILNDRGLRLRAIYASALEPTSRTAVIVHGYTSRAVDMLMIGYMYNRELGYNILLPDLARHGQSEGEAIGMGWHDRRDVMRWAEFADGMRSSSEPSSIVVHGISMGAATTMMLSGEKLPPYIRCFVEDCGYTSVWDQFKKELREDFSLPSWPLLDAASWLCRMRYGWDFHEASAVKAVSRCHLPMLFIHGDKDGYVPTWMVEELYKAKPAPKKLWIVPDAAHAVSYLHNQEEYTRRVREFVEPCMEHNGLPLRKKATGNITAHPKKPLRLHGTMHQREQ